MQIINETVLLYKKTTENDQLFSDGYWGLRPVIVARACLLKRLRN